MENNNLVERDGNLYYRTVTKQDVVKPITLCTPEELEQNKIVEKDGNIFIEIPKEKTIR
jgi:hypothetical protein